jgi:hypothetical protein
MNRCARQHHDIEPPSLTAPVEPGIVAIAQNAGIGVALD